MLSRRPDTLRHAAALITAIFFDTQEMPEPRIPSTKQGLPVSAGSAAFQDDLTGRLAGFEIDIFLKDRRPLVRLGGIRS
jgi:hypothetical protein